MSRFDNKLCPICRRPLTENSDVVVCPECGTPHHRACYLSVGHCGVEEYHEQGFEWNGYLPGEEPEIKVSPEMGSEELPPETDSEFSEEHRADYPGGVSGMGQPMDIEDFIEHIHRQTMDETRGADGVSSRELSTFVGRSVMHYSQAFAAFRAPALPGRRRRRVFINVCAGLFAPMHQFYRKMDLLGVVMLLINILFYIPYYMYNAGMGTLEMLTNIQTLARFLSFAGMILVCLFGDYLYYRHAVKCIHRIRAKFNDGKAEGYYEALAAKGSPSWLRTIAITLAFSIIFSLFMIVTGNGIPANSAVPSGSV